MNDLLLGSLKRSIGTHCRVTCTCFGCASNDPSPLAGPARRAARRGALDPTATTTCVAAASTDFSSSTIVNRITEFLLSAPKLRSDTNLVRAGSRFGFPGPRGAHAPLRLQRLSASSALPRLLPPPASGDIAGAGEAGGRRGERASGQSGHPSPPESCGAKSALFGRPGTERGGPLPLAKTLSHCLASSPARQLAETGAFGGCGSGRPRSPPRLGARLEASRGARESPHRETARRRVARMIRSYGNSWSFGSIIMVGRKESFMTNLDLWTADPSSYRSRNVDAEIALADATEGASR